MMMGSDHDEHAEQPADGESAAEAAMSEPAAETQVGELQERLLRVQAELENFRKRSRREYEDAQRYREIDVLRDLLPVLDNVLRAIEAAEKAVDVGPRLPDDRDRWGCVRPSRARCDPATGGARRRGRDDRGHCEPGLQTPRPGGSSGPSDRGQGRVSDADLRLYL